MKKTLLFVGLGFVALAGLAPHAFAQGFVPLAPIPGLTDLSPTSVINSDTLANFFNNLYKYLIGLAATLAVIEIIWAGLDISFFHKDAASAISTDKGRIYNAIFGLVLVLSPALVFYIINPRILDLSLDLPPISPLAQTPASNPALPKVSSSQNAGILYACQKNDCTSAAQQCRKDAMNKNKVATQAPSVCANADGTIGPNSPDTNFDPPTCATGQVLSVDCITIDSD